MNTIRITTSQNIDLEYDLASVGERIVAWVIDAVLFGAYFIVIFMMIGFEGIGRYFEKSPWMLILLLFPFVFYNLACDILLNGQTIGKKLMKIKVASLNGEQASVGQYLIRWLFRLADIYLFNALVAFITVAVTEKKQRVGDLVAGTVVIKTSARSTINETIYVPTPDVNYQVSFPEVTRLTDKDMQLVREVINSVHLTGNSVLAYQAAERIKKLLAVETNLEPLYFLQVLLADYNHLTAKL
ncbi:MAG TPA: RDD family protein [Chitinophagaceae bacterium]|jgi:uncharacterized RDD family membrane protein YckC|nr:RDD family protein [Chitinophagaceae bacterium]